ncbi:VPLPA-CTERM-specific exosortase XrtD [Albimonas pacifica]|uniref:Exosortase D, VPLPA-CTERM-specific n=1 Tax=Albimonas pacifica TaxID=1114924 RepID=A0A1I3MN58_9RHOB|nr:VPLPA-CTERM-specific exosortase XrtD [Albimonas pacifica]SFI98220.1 exosortase D, VPLPA-CTERM-specific [Albimonas pacifica]
MNKAIASDWGATWNPFGIFWLAIAVVGAALFFLPGLTTLGEAWQLAEYSHGPLIPLLSSFLLLRQLKEVPVNAGPVRDRWPGVAVVCLSLLVGLLGLLSHIGDVSAYALIIWVYGMLLVSFGWKNGAQLWPPVLHLTFMLPLPGLIYYKATTTLQFISSDIGVWALQMMGTPVFLEGNIIDLGVYKLHVAEACSGLRYLFPIMSFSYIFAVLYRGPTWHKAVLLLSAVPIAVLMNSFRIALVGELVNAWGIEQAEGFGHLMEGWVVFLGCIAILFGLAALMLRLQPAPRMGLSEALDLDLNGIMPELARVRHTQASPAMIAAAGLCAALAAAWWLSPPRELPAIDRQPYAQMPARIGEWTLVNRSAPLEKRVERVLGADDYIGLSYGHADAAAPVEFFSAWYHDQTKGGIHSPEVCLPGGGWEMHSIKTVDLAPRLGVEGSFNVNRAVIIKGGSRLLVYYWFDQSGRRIASDYVAKAMLVVNGVVEGRTDGALVRLTTPILAREREADAEARLLGFLAPADDVLPRFVDGRI